MRLGLTTVSVLCVIALSPAAAREQQQRYFDWGSPAFPAEEFVARRQAISQILAGDGGGVFLTPAALGLSSGHPSLDDEPLAPGMVITVEPWYYNHDLPIAVFTEDVILITPQGRENLTGHVARSPEGLEALMRSGRRAPARRD